MDEKSKLDHALKILTRAFPGDRFQKVVRAKEGWDNLVVIADNQWVFRIPMREDYPRQQERWALGKLQGKTQMTIPRIERWSDDPPCMGYRLLPGIPAPKEWLSQPSSSWLAELAQSLALFLNECHQAISLEEAKAAGLKEFSLHPSSFQELLDQAKDMNPEHRQFAESFLKIPETVNPGSQIFLYGDLHPGNLLFDPASRKLTAVLDFGTVSWGDPSCEFYDLGGSWPGLCEATVQEYENLSGVKVNRNEIRRQAVLFCLSIFAEDKLQFMRPSAARRMDNLIRSKL
jgi:aminoglycoside phosphotransferase (APT) family kinase protein